MTTDPIKAVSHITTHVLDAVRGLPAPGIAVVLSALRDGEWMLLGEGVTDADGRAKQLGPEALPVGTYRLHFDTGGYFARTNTPTFYPEVVLTFVVDDEQRHYHVPLLLSPFAYSTYRGS